MDRYNAPLKLSKYQLTMKAHYDQQDQRAKELFEKEKQIPDYLNEWKYCDPENLTAELPQPYRGINDILEEDIFNEVWRRIVKIEEEKKDPSYEADLLQIIPSGELPTLVRCASAVAEAPNNTKKQLFLGDRHGNLYVFDQLKKVIICKYDQLIQRKRVEHISVESLKLEDGGTVVTLAVVQRATPQVQILRYDVTENVLTPEYLLPCPKFAVSTNLSIHSAFCSVSLYNGNVEVYRIPEPLRQKQLENQISPVIAEVLVPISTLANNKQQLQQKQIEQQKTAQPSQLIKWCSIEFTGVRREKTYLEMLSQVCEDNEKLRQLTQGENAIQGVPIVDTKKKDPISNTKNKSDKIQAVSLEEVIQCQQLPDLLQNDSEVSFPPDTLDTEEGDISQETRQPKYQAQTFFLSEKITKENPNRLFGKPISAQVTTSIIVIWLNTKDFVYYPLQSATWSNLPVCLRSNLIKNIQLVPNSILKTEPAQYKPTQNVLQKYSLIYPITCAEICGSEKYLAFGLSDGNVILWDNEFRVNRKHFIDAHDASVTSLAFFHEQQLLSGCMNGQLIIHQLTKKSPAEKRFNQFEKREKNAIIKIRANKFGLIAVLDASSGLRLYNTHLGDKVAILVPAIFKQEEPQVWQVNPKCLFHLSEVADQLYLLSCDTKLNRQIGLAVYKLSDNLTQVYEGVKNLLRNGVSLDRVLFEFTRMTKKQLNDRSLQIDQEIASMQNDFINTNTQPNSTSRRSKLSFATSTQERPAAGSPSEMSLFHRASHSEKLPRISEIPKKSLLPSLTSMRESLLGNVFRSTRISNQISNKQGLTKAKLHPEQFMWKDKFSRTELLDPSNSTIVHARELASKMYSLQHSLSSSMILIEKSLKQKEEQRFIFLEYERRKHADNRSQNLGTQQTKSMFIKTSNGQ